MAFPTGEQLEINGDGHRAVVTRSGRGCGPSNATASRTSRPSPPRSKPPLGAGCVLVPWPNRVAGATWQGHQLEVTEPARGNAIHGLVRQDSVDGHRPGRQPRRARGHRRQRAGLAVPLPHHDPLLARRQRADRPPRRPQPRRRRHAVRRRHAPLPPARQRRRGRLRAHASPPTTRLPLDPDSMIPNGDPVPLPDNGHHDRRRPTWTRRSAAASPVTTASSGTRLRGRARRRAGLGRPGLPLGAGVHARPSSPARTAAPSRSSR